MLNEFQRYPYQFFFFLTFKNHMVKDNTHGSTNDFK